MRVQAEIKSKRAMEVIPAPLLLLVFSKASAEDCARAACVATTWRLLLSEDSLWIAFLQQDFALSQPPLLLPSGAPCSSPKAAYALWHSTFKHYPRALVLRAKKCWDGIRSWAKSEFPDLHKTLLPGASEEEIDEAEETLGFKLPLPARLLYRFCNGQAQDLSSERLPCHGILGGYSFYGRHVNTCLFCLEIAVKLTQKFVPGLALRAKSQWLILAASPNSKKVFFLDCADGMVYVGTKYLNWGEMMNCAPFNVANGGDFHKDGMLRWLEEYGNCVQSGMFGVEQAEKTQSISLFPRKEPLQTEAVTSGVQVRCSAVFVPEMSTLKDEEDKYTFTYQVRMRLLPSQAGNSMESCQLSSRHWIIKAEDRDIHEVRGGGVIGKHPLLHENGEEFVYESYTPLDTCSGSIEGDFTFVPGSLARPKGAEFLAFVARVPLLVPQYIF